MIITHRSITYQVLTPADLQLFTIVIANDGALAVNLFAVNLRRR